MKALRIILLCAAALFCSAATIVIHGPARHAAAASTEYFGNTDTTAATSFDEWGGYTIRWRSDATAYYTCPGSGSRTLQSMELYCKSNGGTPGTIRLALFDTSLNLVAEGSATVTVSSTTVGWVGHLTAADLRPVGGSSGDPITLTGGTNYLPAYSASSSDVRIAYEVVGTSMTYLNNNYTGGFPTTIAAGTNLNQSFRMKLGVQ